MGFGEQKGKELGVSRKTIRLILTAIRVKWEGNKSGKHLGMKKQLSDLYLKTIGVSWDGANRSGKAWSKNGTKWETTGNITA